MNQESFENRQRRGRRIFVLVAVAFLGPLFLAVALYLGGGWSPGSTIQHGILLKPPGLLPELTLPPPTGGREPASLRGKWTLIYPGPGECAARKWPGCSGCSSLAAASRITHISSSNIPASSW